MINDGVNNVPDNKIAVFTTNEMSYEDVDKIVTKPSSKREWFTPHFYSCLPLSIANTYGFIVRATYDVEVLWTGDADPTSLKINHDKGPNDRPEFLSMFGYGILTIAMPLHFRTPPGVNLITMAPPNYILPFMTVMSGVVETDNLRQEFTFNIKLQIPDITLKIEKGTPLSAFMPIPRYYCDAFELENAENIFPKKEVDLEQKAKLDQTLLRNNANYQRIVWGQSIKPDRFYMRGMDLYGNKFKDHQNMGGKKKKND